MLGFSTTRRLKAIDRRLYRIDQLLFGLVQQLQKDADKMTAMDEVLARISADVQAEGNAVAAATKLIGGFNQALTDAIANALGKGATTAQLQAVNDVAAALEAQTASLSNAIAANTGASGDISQPVAAPTPLGPPANALPTSSNTAPSGGGAGTGSAPDPTGPAPGQATATPATGSTTNAPPPTPSNPPPNVPDPNSPTGVSASDGTAQQPSAPSMPNIPLAPDVGKADNVAAPTTTHIDPLTDPADIS